MVAQGIAAEHPDWTIEKVFKESAVKTREILRMPEYKPDEAVTTQTETKTEDVPTSGAFVDQKGIRGRSTPSISALQREIDEL